MRVFKNRLVQRIIILGLSFVVITVALFVKQNRPPGKIAGTVTNPILVANKFCDDPANSQQAACINFISDVLAEAGSPTYQDVTGNVGITGNTHITGTTSIGTEDITNKLNVEGGDIGVRSGSGIRLYNPVNNAYSTINFDGTQTYLTWNLKVDGQITSSQNGAGANWNSGLINLIDTSNSKVWQITNRGEGDPGSNRNKFMILHRSDDTNWVWPYAFILDGGGNLTLSGSLTQGSSKDYKKDISYLTDNNYQEILNQLNNTNLINYKYKDDDPNTKIHLGIIAEDAPTQITSDDRKGIRTSDYLAFLLGAIKAQQKEIESLQKEVEELKKK